MADAEAIIGAKVEVFNPDENLWATGRIERYYPDKGWLMQYYDGDSAWVPSLENVQIMQRVDGSDDEEGDEVDGQVNHNTPSLLLRNCASSRSFCFPCFPTRITRNTTTPASSRMPSRR